MKRRIIFVFLSFTWLTFVPAGSWAYDGGAVSNGGTISGVVNFKGTAATPKKLKITKDKKACDKSPKTDPTLIVSDGKLVNAVVFIKDIKKGKAIKKGKIQMDQNGCEYSPHVLAITAGSKVEFLNPDKILHNIHTYSKANKPVNRAQPKFKKKLKIKFTKPEVIAVKCDVHGWMSGWLFVSENPYYSVTDAQGGFKLTDVPAGTYTVEVWHETLGTASQKVTVKPKGSANITLEIGK